MKAIRMVLLILTVFCMIGKNGICAEAAEVGRIHIFLEEEKAETQRQGILFSYTKVADWSEGSFEMKENFRDSGVNLNQIETAQQQEDAAKKLSLVQKVADGSKLTDNKGEAVLANLEPGVYLLEGKETKKYGRITPFLVTIPTWDEESGQMIYEVSAFPKHTPKVEVEENVKTGDQDWKIEYGFWAILSAGGVILSLRKRK